MTELQYKRVLLKLSGESLSAGPGQFGIDAEAKSAIVEEIASLAEMKVELAVVLGAGNLMRGRHLADDPTIERTTADYMGMLATISNALALRDTLTHRGLRACVMSALPLEQICEPFSARKARCKLADGVVVIFAGGTGCPYFTTDTGAALRACEVNADAVIKGTKVDGVFSADPETDPSATKYDRLSYDQVIADNLQVMDLTAVSLCRENHLPIVVYNYTRKGALGELMQGQQIGTVVSD